MHTTPSQLQGWQTFEFVSAVQKGQAAHWKQRQMASRVKRARSGFIACSGAMGPLASHLQGLTRLSDPISAAYHAQAPPITGT